MAISYDNLWKLLIDKKLKRTDLKSTCGISSIYGIVRKNMFSIGLQHRRYNAIC